MMPRVTVIGLPGAGVAQAEHWLEANGFRLERLKRPSEELAAFRAGGGLVIGISARDEHRFLRGVRAGDYAPSDEGWRAAMADSRDLACSRMWAHTQVVVFNDIPELLLSALVDDLGLHDLDLLHAWLRHVRDGLEDDSLWCAAGNGMRYECVTLGRPRPVTSGLQMHHPKSMELREGVA
jgi:hypothetical protein